MIEAADEATDDALKVEGLHNSFAAVHGSFNGPSRRFAAMQIFVGYRTQERPNRKTSR
jgi:hypothetical protein